MKRTRLKRIFVSAVSAAAVATCATVVGVPTAAAAPVPATTLTPLIGLGETTGSAAINGLGLMYETISVSVDPERPGVSLILGSTWCSCLLTWQNETTGATGTTLVGSRATFPSGPVEQVTGSGRVTANVVNPNGPTFVPAVGSWDVP